MFTDPIADMSVRLLNANKRGYKTVIIPASKFKLEICKKLKEKKFLSQYYWDKEKKIIKVNIKYYNKTSSLNEIKKTSIYLKVSDLKKKCVGQRVYLISTSQGLLNYQEALQRNIGGKLIFVVS